MSRAIRLLFPGKGGATAAASASTGALDSTKQTKWLLTATNNTWVTIGPASGLTAVANTGQLVTNSFAIEVVVPLGYAIAYIDAGTVGAISIVQIDG